MTAQSFRWQFERALEASDLPAMTRWLLDRIAARADARTGIIEARYVPAEASLAAATGMSVRSVRTHLQTAEDRGWLVIEHRAGRKSALALAVPGDPFGDADPGRIYRGTPAGFADGSDR